MVEEFSPVATQESPPRYLRKTAPAFLRELLRLPQAHFQPAPLRERSPIGSTQCHSAIRQPEPRAYSPLTARLIAKFRAALLEAEALLPLPRAPLAHRTAPLPPPFAHSAG